MVQQQLWVYSVIDQDEAFKDNLTYIAGAYITHNAAWQFCRRIRCAVIDGS